VARETCIGTEGWRACQVEVIRGLPRRPGRLLVTRTDGPMGGLAPREACATLHQPPVAHPSIANRPNCPPSLGLPQTRHRIVSHVPLQEDSPQGRWQENEGEGEEQCAGEEG
jgi:hypothetical protein